MLIASARKGFDDSDRLLQKSKHQYKDINLRNGRVTKDFADEADFLHGLTGKRVLLLVHGYNSKQENIYGAYRLIAQQIEQMVPGQYDAVIGYIWPGGDHFLEWWMAKRRANSVARRFAALLNSISNKTAALDLMSHSLGARVALSAIDKSQLQQPVRNYFCMAPAVDNECLEAGEEYANAVSKLAQMYVFHSKYDLVLATGYPVTELDNALGLLGPEDVEYVEQSLTHVYVANCKRVITNHRAYKSTPAIFKYISQTFDHKPPRFHTL